MEASHQMGMLFVGSIGFPEMVFILLIALVLFGGKRLGDIGRGLGQGIRNFKTAVKDDKHPDQDKEQKPS
jgi:sec-independent protein translocase protein TatA